MSGSKMDPIVVKVESESSSEEEDFLDGSDNETNQQDIPLSVAHSGRRNPSIPHRVKKQSRSRSISHQSVNSYLPPSVLKSKNSNKNNNNTENTTAPRNNQMLENSGSQMGSSFNPPPFNMYPTPFQFPQQYFPHYPQSACPYNYPNTAPNNYFWPGQNMNPHSYPGSCVPPPQFYPNPAQQQEQQQQQQKLHSKIKRKVTFSSPIPQKVFTKTVCNGATQTERKSSHDSENQCVSEEEEEEQENSNPLNKTTVGLDTGADENPETSSSPLPRIHVQRSKRRGKKVPSAVPTTPSKNKGKKK